LKAQGLYSGFYGIVQTYVICKGHLFVTINQNTKIDDIWSFSRPMGCNAPLALPLSF